MQFSYTDNGSGSKFGKFALVAGLHVALGALVMHNLGTRTLTLPGLTDQVMVLLEPTRLEPPPPPPPPPTPMPRLAPPDVVVPRIEVEVAPPPDPAPLAAVTSELQPFPAMPAATALDTPPAVPGNAGTNAQARPAPMRTAVLADAGSCALPDYPARAARDGISGTTLLALLVGIDGRVTSARVEHSSGSRELDRAAVGALSLCRFKPATSNGVAEAAWGQIAYVWTLEQ